MFVYPPGICIGATSLCPNKQSIPHISFFINHSFHEAGIKKVSVNIVFRPTLFKVGKSGISKLFINTSMVSLARYLIHQDTNKA